MIEGKIVPLAKAGIDYYIGLSSEITSTDKMDFRIKERETM